MLITLKHNYYIRDRMKPTLVCTFVWTALNCNVSFSVSVIRTNVFSNNWKRLLSNIGLPKFENIELTHSVFTESFGLRDTTAFKKFVH